MTIQYDGSRRTYREQSPDTEQHSDGLVCVAVGLFALLLIGLVARGEVGGAGGQAEAAMDAGVQRGVVWWGGHGRPSVVQATSVIPSGARDLAREWLERRHPDPSLRSG